MDYRKIIESRYNSKDWQELLYDIFRQKIQFREQPQQVPVDETMAKQAFYTGKITLSDGHILAVYEVELSDNVSIKRNRAGIRNLLCSNWKGMGCVGAFMFCFRKNEAVLRFSYVSESFAFAEDGSLKKESTDTKRFTYLLGKGHRSRTAIKQFEELKKSALDLKAITKAFSVEALSDAFFNEYKKQYEDIVEFITGKRMVKVSNKWEEKVTGKPYKEIMQEFSQFPDAEKAVRDYVKKLMGRLVFIQFLQKKGWMGCPAGEAWNGGDKEFVQNLFANAKNKDTFVDDVLEPLFNDINTKRTGDLTSCPNIGTNIKIPYLNGGLFENDNHDNISFPLPKKFMQNLLDFFANYNFTIDENDPDDAEIGVDPEMLGRIFENMLEDNKDKGAFYTPKEIVQYMCRESLIAYLQTDVTDETTKESIRQFVTTHDATILTDELKAVIDQQLKDVKICDPAIGSGAFPMGLLHELYTCRKPLEGIDDNTAANIKAHIIQNNIYGVDIEKGAVEIARLRFWLALVVDEKTPHTLPNLDFKIMQGNSLLESYEGMDLSRLSYMSDIQIYQPQRNLFGELEDRQIKMVFSQSDKLKDFQKNLSLYFRTTGHVERAQLRKAINSYVRDTIVYTLNTHIQGEKLKIKQICLSTTLSDKQKKSIADAEANITHLEEAIEDVKDMELPNSNFFLWHTYFKDVFEKGGFDIVIGNPPYVNVQLMSDAAKNLYKKLYSVFIKRCDLFALFVEKGLMHLSSDKGIVTFIIPSVVHSNMSYTKLRDIILNNRWLKEVCYTGGDVFNAPTVDTTILICNKNGNSDITLKNAVDFSRPTVKTVSSGYFSMFNNVISVIGTSDADELYSKVLNEQFELLGKRYTVFQGIVTGNNPAFIFEDESEALAKGIERELLHPLCHGRDIEKYMVRSRNRRILYIDGSINIEDYPYTKEWLMNFKEALDKRNEGKRDVISWCSLHRPRVKSELDLKEKILIQNTRNEALKIRMAATLDDTGIYGTQGLNFIIPKDGKADLHYLLGILNSKLINYLFATKFLNLAIKAEYLKQIRIPGATPFQKETLVSLVDTILVNRKNNSRADTTSLEHEIDLLVYDLYGLTKEERLIVDPDYKE